ncbi:ABC transporter ATP-binding protein [Ectobacillus ponti]|uniref:ABC transporter ATP-binding protein n=1 Tax=Ectobacillus ponti TaxID=2961894 RepID=A0AA41X1M8_9BACI|nr:ABC transporter ATP-binding protein [Ectobacillus ponti]MCP8966947.1 ABC transporter ATP-binding protein [Ectobacillus ponti]
MLRVEQMTKKIDGREVLSQISFSLEKGSIAALLGRNGAGKTTLLRTMVGILNPDSGSVTYDGTDVHRDPSVKQKVAYVADSTHFLNSYTVAEIVRFYASVYEGFDKEYFYALLERFQLPERRIRHYSKGMKALFGIILAFATKADYIILDEPTNGLDPIMKRQMLQFLVEEMTDRETAVLISTHHLDEVEKIADTIIMLQDNRIASVTSLDETKLHYTKIQVAFAQSLPQKLEHLSNVTLLEKTGKVHTFLIRGNVNATVQKFAKEQPLLLEEIPMSLEDIFVTELGGDSHVS